MAPLMNLQEIHGLFGVESGYTIGFQHINRFDVECQILCDRLAAHLIRRTCEIDSLAHIKDVSEERERTIPGDYCARIVKHNDLGYAPNKSEVFTWAAVRFSRLIDKNGSA
jgi:hypothetical protein